MQPKPPSSLRRPLTLGRIVYAVHEAKIYNEMQLYVVLSVGLQCRDDVHFDQHCADWASERMCQNVFTIGLHQIWPATDRILRHNMYQNVFTIGLHQISPATDRILRHNKKRKYRNHSGLQQPKNGNPTTDWYYSTEGKYVSSHIRQ